MTETINETNRTKSNKARRPFLFLLIPLVIMIFFDQIMWKRPGLGMQFLVLVVLLLAGLFILVLVQKVSVPWQSFLLLVPILFGAVMTFVRAEGATVFSNIILALWGLALLAMTLLNGQWLGYRVREVLGGLLKIVISAFVEPVKLLKKKAADTEVASTMAEKHAGWRKVSPYLRGLLIALPLLLIFGALLANADAIFKERLGNLLDWIRIENFGDFVFRTIYILIFSTILAGIFAMAVLRSDERKALSPDQPLLKPFLGHVEALVVLVLVNLLFALFIFVQFQYFFAGQANISIEGYTYAEYARRGFFELVAVAIISLVLYYVLHSVTKRSHKAQRIVFSILGLLLLLQVGLMLVSAFQRLSLYEAAYGFTTLRTITHVFMIWLGVLLLAAALMEIFGQFKRLALVLFLVFFGFTLTLSLLNVDKFIAERNVEHAVAGNQLDARYLVWNLSDDGIPTLYERSRSSDTPDKIKSALEKTLVCTQASHLDEAKPSFWASYHLAKAKAEALYQQNPINLNGYPFVTKEENYITYDENNNEISNKVNIYYVVIDGEEIYCADEPIP